MLMKPTVKAWRCAPSIHSGSRYNDGKELTMADQEPIAFGGARKKAEAYASDPTKVVALLHAAQEKASREEKRLEGIWSSLQALFRLLAAWARGRYTVIPWKTVVLAIAGVIYFVNPFDLAFDYLPLIGYLDDITVVGFVMNSVRKDIDRFLDWERTNVPG
jgi:uncharacterized membrane protein YkvA (DUF1232 family)